MHPDNPTLAQLVVEVYVRDIARSKEFYQRLGWSIAEDRGSFVVLEWDGHQLFLDEKPDLPPPPTYPRVNVRVMVPDVDAYWIRAIETGAIVSVQIGDRGYGLRDFVVHDPDGFGLRYASPVRI